MSLLQGALSLVHSFLTFYLPVFFTFRYLMSNDAPRIRAVLKFWCILTLEFVASYLLAFIVKGYLAVLLDIAALALLNYDNFAYSEKLYDSFVSPFFRTHQETIQHYTQQLEQLFQNNSQRLKDKVASSAGDRIKGFMGEVLVGVLNPKQQLNVSTRSSRSSRDPEDSDQEEKEEKEE